MPRWPGWQRLGELISAIHWRTWRSATDRRFRMHGTRWNWKQLFNYGEVICFASAWLVALLMAVSAQRTVDDRAATRTFAISSDVGGMQARR
jgi:hypothetical protein